MRERVDSPPESRLRLCLVLAGLPEPACNVDLGDDSFFIATPDLAYLVYRLLLEYEGDHHRTDRAQWQKDIRRERQLRKAGFEVQRITAETLRRPRELVDDVHALLVKAGYAGPSPVFSPDWIAHFAPGRSERELHGGFVALMTPASSHSMRCGPDQPGYSPRIRSS